MPTLTRRPIGDGYVSFASLYTLILGIQRDTLVPLKDEYPYSYPFDERALDHGGIITHNDKVNDK